MNFSGKGIIGFISAVFVFVAIVQPASAVQRIDFGPEHWYVGGGLNHNSLDNFDNAYGIQAFAGLDLPYKPHRQITTHVEMGVITTEDFENANRTTDHTGVWTTGLTKVHITPRFRGLARLGVDFGDDDGLMAGFGGELEVRNNWFARGEFVARDSINSIQANLVYHF